MVPRLVVVLAPVGARLIVVLAPAGARVGASLGSAPGQEQSLELRSSCVLWFDFGSRAGNLWIALCRRAGDLNSCSQQCQPTWNNACGGRALLNLSCACLRLANNC